MNPENSPILHKEHDVKYTSSPARSLSSSNVNSEKSQLNVGSDPDCHSVLGKTEATGQMSKTAIYCIIIWYFFSFTTLFLNKYILSFEQGDPTILGSAQLIMCAVCGYAQLHYPCKLYKSMKWDRNPPRFFRNMLLVGSLRFSTLILGLVALWYVPVSFAETVKSSAPVFTVLLAWLLMGEKTSFLVCLSLIPVMGGLALCSANELSFNAAGFIAAMLTNLSECPPELQYYTSIASVCVQIPAFIMMTDLTQLRVSLTSRMLFLLVLNGFSFHCQSITEYSLLCFISPVTHSVVNTVKRAFLIWLSVITFGNKVTFLGGLGTAIVILGVFAYNKAKEIAPTVLIEPKASKNVHLI